MLWVAAGDEGGDGDDGDVDAMEGVEIPAVPDELESNGVWCKDTEAIPPGLLGPLVVDSKVLSVALVQTKNGPLGSRVIAVPTTV